MIRSTSPAAEPGARSEATNAGPCGEPLPPEADAAPALRAQLISLYALARARTTIEDFTLSYLPMHGLAPLDGLLRFADMLVFTSAALYELDEQNERLTAAGIADEALELPGAPRACNKRPQTGTSISLMALRDRPRSAVCRAGGARRARRARAR